MRILVADDDKNLRKVLVNELSEEPFDVHEADNGSKAIDLLEKNGFDVLVLDLNMPGINGIDVLKKIKALEIPVEVVVLTGNATVPTAIEAMKLGAYDFLTKPFNLEELRAIVVKAGEKRKLLHENLVLRTQIKRQLETDKIITKSPIMIEILDNLKRVAISSFPVLVQGESGVGKELIAKAIHGASEKPEGPFIPINCGAIPENMLESELFGHEKGAFTGAYSKKPGLLEIADHGILFLDEISELTLSLQGKLLRVIETGKFFRMGGIKEVSVDARFISATNRDVKKEVEKNSFRPDLYYRISTITLSIPPLRERREDIPLLVEHMMKNTPAFKKKRFSDEALRSLCGYSWPGNVRELQNVVHMSLLLSKNDVILPSDLPTDLLLEREVQCPRIEDVEREHILKVLKEVGGRKGKAAEILGLDPKTLYRKLLSYKEEQS